MKSEDARGKNKKNKVDPVVSDQGGRLMPVDPFGRNQPKEQTVRLRAYELYEKRGRQEGHAMDHWLEAESQVH
jgi:Protein of unknown function (DUF2934)